MSIKTSFLCEYIRNGNSLFANPESKNKVPEMCEHGGIHIYYILDTLWGGGTPSTITSYMTPGGSYAREAMTESELPITLIIGYNYLILYNR